MARRGDILTENYCDECDEVLNQVFDKKAFFAGKVGALICPKCGHVMMPCNECEDHDACGDCPWAKADKCVAMSDEAYIRYIRAYEPKTYKMLKSGDNGDYYAKIIAKIEKGG